jgi:hypothetical protein
VDRVESVVIPDRAYNPTENRTEVKPDGAREIRWGEGAGVALCGCGRPLSEDGGGGRGDRDLNSEPGQRDGRISSRI